MKYKEGDILVCKKSRYWEYINIHFVEGQEYKVHYINDGYPGLIIDNKQFTLNSEHSIREYFHTTKRIRNMKLKTILQWK